ncbi:AIR synthase family protein [Faecalimonas canis]
MKIGNVSQTVIRRSILKQLKTKREEAVIEPSVEEMCSGISVPNGQQIVFTNVTLYGDEKDIAVFGLAQALNDLYTRGATPIGVNLSILLPPYAYESRLKSMVEFAEKVAEKQNIQILNVKAQVSPVITKAVVTVVGIGTVKEGELLQSNMGRANQDIVMTKWIGLEGMLRIVREKGEELSKRFVPAFMSQVNALEKNLFADKELKLAKEYGVSAMHQITDGGILAALWNMAEASDVGVEVDLKKIAVKQETIEICEYFQLNPYQMTSAGSVLLMADNGKGLVDLLLRNEIQAEVIGRTTADRDRVIFNQDEKRYIDRPAQDELLKIYAE